MQTGRFAAARDRLQQIIALRPDIAQAHWLLAGALLNTGAVEAAEHSVRTAVRLDPRNASSAALLGEILQRQGRADEAERSLRHALALSPHHLPAATRLVELLLAQARPREALALVDEHLQRFPRDADLLQQRARACLALGERAQAIAMFQQATRIAPQSFTARLGLATALADDDQHQAAEVAARAAAAQGPLDPRVHFVLARALLGERRPEAAEAEFREAIRLRPEYVEAHVNLAEALWMRTGDAARVAAEIDASLQTMPALNELRALKAKLLEAAGQPEAAMQVLDEAIARAPDDAGLQVAAAQLAVKHDAARALAHAEAARTLGPDNPLIRSTYGNALLAAGRAAEAAATATRLLASDPTDGLALAMRASAWRMQGDPRYPQLCDYGTFVRPDVIDTPAGWPTLAAYLDQLTRELLQLHTLRTHPIGQSLRNGTQVDLAFSHATEPAIRAFAQAIDGPIRRYMRAIGHGAHPVQARNVERYRLSGAWSVRLRPHGYHFNHYHPDGWLSSACYIQLPPGLGAHGGEGWLTFGESGFPTQPLMPAEYFVRPEPGLLVLFPAWMWHGTIPFSGAPTDCRLTIAFDIVPD